MPYTRGLDLNVYILLERATATRSEILISHGVKTSVALTHEQRGGVVMVEHSCSRRLVMSSGQLGAMRAVTSGASRHRHHIP